MAEVAFSPTAEPVRKGGTQRMEALQQFGFKPNDGEQQKKYGATTYLNTHMENPDALIGNQRADIRNCHCQLDKNSSQYFPKIHKKTSSDNRLLLLGSDNGHVVKH